MIAVNTRPDRPQVSLLLPGSKSYTHRSLIAAALLTDRAG